MRNFGLRLPLGMLAAIKKEAARIGTSESETVRLVLEQYFGEQK